MNRSINILPTELLTMIFGHYRHDLPALLTIASVCRRWRALVHDRWGTQIAHRRNEFQGKFCLQEMEVVGVPLPARDGSWRIRAQQLDLCLVLIGSECFLRLRTPNLNQDAIRFKVGGVCDVGRLRIFKNEIWIATGHNRLITIGKIKADDDDWDHASYQQTQCQRLPGPVCSLVWTASDKHLFLYAHLPLRVMRWTVSLKRPNQQLRAKHLLVRHRPDPRFCALTALSDGTMQITTEDQQNLLLDYRPRKRRRTDNPNT